MPSAKILVIDDDPSIVNLVKEVLEADGHQILTGYDGQTAVDIAKVELPQLIIMDVNMPETSGLRAAEMLSAIPGTRAIPIIFLTGDASKEDVPASTKDVRIAKLKKPFDLDGLSMLVRRFLEGS